MSSDFATADTLVIASDIGKNVHWLGCYDGRLNVLVESHKLRSDLNGFRQMTATVDPLLIGGRFRQAILGHEFTGIYHEPWSGLMMSRATTSLSERGDGLPTIDRRTPVLVLLDLAAYNVKVEIAQFDRNRSHLTISNRAMVYSSDGRDLHAGATEKHLVGQVDFGAVDGAFDDLYT